MIFVLALVGMVVGSFLNVCIDRLPQGQSLLRPPSHCPSCQRRLAIRDLVPVASYLWLRGRCRYCGAHIPFRILAVELTTGAVFAFLWWQYSFGIMLFLLAFYSSLFIVLAAIDLEQGLILNKIVYPATLLSLAIAPFRPDLGIISAVIGGGLFFSLFLMVNLVYRGSMGWGDVKLAALIGLVTGFPLVIIAIQVAVVLGGLVAGLLLLLRLKGRKETIPFGPFLSAGALITLFWGQHIFDWYLRLLS